MQAILYRTFWFANCNRFRTSTGLAVRCLWHAVSFESGDDLWR